MAGGKEHAMAREFRYQPLSAFDLLLSLTESQLRQLDAFFELSKTSLKDEEQALEQRAERSRGGYPDDFLGR